MRRSSGRARRGSLADAAIWPCVRAVARWGNRTNFRETTTENARPRLSSEFARQIAICPVHHKRSEGPFEYDYPARYPFLSGGGEAAEIIAGFDWAATPLGPIENWPASLKSAIALILRSPVPIVTLWGEDGIMIYNDGYSAFAGGRHPNLFGSKVREGWPEVADFNDNIMKVGLAGQMLAYRDFPLTLYRHGGDPEQVWLNLDYSPLLGEDGRPAGVMAIVIEITDKVRIERELDAERKSLKLMFEQAPGFIAMLSGPKHRFTMVNAAYRALVAGRDVVGRAVAEALPEVVEQGFVGLLDRVYASGEPYIGRGVLVNLQHGPEGVLAERTLDFIYQPIVVDDGATTGIFIQGHDATEQHETEKAVRAESRKLDVLNRTGAALAAELNVDKIVQIATDACSEIVDAEFGAFFYNVTNDKGESYMLYALSGVSREHFDKISHAAQYGRVRTDFQGRARRPL